MKRKGKPTLLWTGSLLLIIAIFLTPLVRAEVMEPQIAAGNSHSIGVRSDGTVLAVGRNNAGQTNVSGWTDIVAAAGGDTFTAGLKSDGTVVAVGDNTFHQTEVTGTGWTGITALATGLYHTVGRKSDGTVITAGSNANGQRNVDDWTDIKAVGASGQHTVGLKEDGTVVAVGWNLYHQTEVTGTGWTDIVAIAAGPTHTVGLKRNGTVVTAGGTDDADFGQTDVGSWTNIVAVTAQRYRTIGLKSDGTVVAVGENEFGERDVTGTAWTDIVAVAAGDLHTLGLKSDGTVVAAGINASGQSNVGSWYLDMDTSMKGTKGTQLTLHGSGFGTKKGTITMASSAMKVVSWHDSLIIFQLSKALAPSEYSITITPKGKNPVPITYGESFFAKGPKLEFLWPNAGVSGDTIVLYGKYFGSKKGKIALGTTQCPVTWWYMSPDTGESAVAFKVPKKLTSGYYDVTLTNDLGPHTFPASPFTRQ